MLAFEIIAGVASIIGLGFSMAAFWQAKSASAAAREARDSILIRTLADEFALVCERIEQLSDLIEHDRFPEATMRAHEVATALSELPFRRGTFLTTEWQNQMLNARTQVEVAAREISRARARPMTQDRKQKLIQAYRQNAANLRERLGTIKAKVEAGGQR